MILRNAVAIVAIAASPMLYGQFFGFLGQDTTISMANRDYLGNFLILPNGNTLIAARAERTTGTGSGTVNKHGAFLEISPSGQIVQQRRPAFRSLSALYAHPDGNYIVTGEGSGFACTSGMCKSDVLVAKVNASGSIIWARSFGNTVYNGSDGGREVVGLANGDILLLGNVYEANNRSNALVVRLNASGDTVWVRAPGANSNQFAYCAAETADGKIFVGVGGTGGIQLLNYSATGNLLWAKTYNQFGQASKLIPLANGNLLLAGHGLISPNYHWFTIEVNPQNGQIIRGKTYITQQTENRVNYLQDALVMANGDYVLAGYGFLTTTTNNANQAIIMRVSADGEVVWSKTYYEDNAIIDRLLWHEGRIHVGMTIHTASQTNRPDLGFYALNPDGANNCFVPLAVETGSLPQPMSNRSFYSFAGVETGTSTPGTSSLTFWTTPTCSPPALLSSGEIVSASPPFVLVDDAFIYIKNVPDGTGRVRLIDVSGREIIRMNSIQDATAINRQGIPPGIYIFMDENNSFSPLRIVLP